ncbi:hypothetical protein [Sphingomonas sp. LT1P40]|uniref:hypothetical protein n=1 Tax=Alteristakelama amylovorans TaxID=3096166 RepID=UPI002FC5D153
MIRKLLFAACLTLPAAAQAEWVRAESTNYIAYSEGTAEDLKKRVADLEKFSHVLQAMTGARRPKEVPVRITVYFVRTVDDVSESLPYPAPGVAGYYNTTMRGPFTVMPRISTKPPAGARYKMPGLEAKTVLQHELTHHFMFQYFAAAYPAWYTEGFADYAGAIEIDDNNVVKVGLFLDNRAQALRSMDWVHLKELMNPIPGKSNFERFAIYSQGWITVHYLNSTPEGRKMLGDYLKRINAGQNFGEALKAFGDIEKFNAAVRAYARRSKIDASATQYLSLDPGKIEVAKLGAAEDALLTAQMSLSSGVATGKAQGFARRVREIARAHPDNLYALRMLIEAERLAGNFAEATAATNRWLARQPADPWANYFKGDMETVALAKAKSTDNAAWDAARARIRVALKALPNEPRFARAFYESYSRRGVLPPAAAQNALSHALDLIPRESTLRYMVASDYETRGMIDDAISTIAPDAYGIADETEKDKRRRERVMDQYKTAEDEDDKETPREMLVRLLAKKSGKTVEAKETAATQ